MLITRFDELSATADGQHVEVQGRYERYNPNLAPPGHVPVSARVVLHGGAGVLIGRYYDPESRRPDDELAGLAGAIVRVAGTFFKYREFPGPGPPPGLWAGGGPQVVDVGSVQLIEPAKPIVTAPAIPIPERPAEVYTPIASTIPSQVGPLARRSLAQGASPIVAVAYVVGLLAAGAGLFVAQLAVGSPLSQHFVSGVAVVGGLLVGWGVDLAITHWLAAHELRWLASLPWTFDLPSYVAQLDDVRGQGALRVDVELVRPVGEASRSSRFDARRLGRATVGWTSDRALSILCPSVKTEWSSYPLIGRSRYGNARVHRWFRRCVIRALAPLHAACQIRTIKTRIE